MMMANQANERQCYAEAFRLYMEAAEKNGLTAQAHVGFMYLHGTGVGKNEEKAFYWLKKAASQGDNFEKFPKVARQLGMMYEDGIGTKSDLSRAEHWYRKAAEANDYVAMYNLARISLANNMNNDIVALYEKAAHGGVQAANVGLGEYYEKDGQYQKAIEWYQQAIKLGYMYGEMYTRIRRIRDILSGKKSDDTLKGQIDSKLRNARIDHGKKGSITKPVG